MVPTLNSRALSELHRIHRQLTDLRERLARGPKQIKASEANVVRCTGDLKLAKDTLVQAKVSANDKQVQLTQREGRIKDLKTKLNQATSNREYQALKEQIAADEQANSVLSDEILEALERIDQLQIKVGEADVTLKKTQEELEKTRQRVAEQQSGLESELARVSAELLQAESQLPEDFRAEYERISRARGEKSMAPLDGNSCGSCYQVLTMQTVDNLRQGRPIFCRNCGVLLYMPDANA